MEIDMQCSHTHMNTLKVHWITFTYVIDSNTVNRDCSVHYTLKGNSKLPTFFINKKYFCS
jgi:hypothetical protein